MYQHHLLHSDANLLMTSEAYVDNGVFLLLGTRVKAQMDRLG